MRSKRKLLNAASLYLILDRQVHGYEKLFEIARSAIDAGVDIIQLRDKAGSAKEILDFARRILRYTGKDIPFIINDRVDLALMSRASGVHLGQDDIPPVVARRMMGSKAIIGVSCQTMAHAKRAVEDGADYIGFGSVYKTLTKPDRGPMDLQLLRRVIETIPVPVFAIGGITGENIGSLWDLGARRVAVCRAVLQAENIGKAVQDFKAKIDEPIC